MIFGVEFTWVTALALVGGFAGIFYFFRLALTIAKILDRLNDLMPVVPVISEMARQFRTDSGSSLRDEINKITEAARQAQLAASLLKETVDNIRATQQGGVTLSTTIGQASAGNDITQEANK